MTWRCPECGEEGERRYGRMVCPRCRRIEPVPPAGRDEAPDEKPPAA